ncbi:XRE family transcriptional regulator [Streptomyces sp. NPDC094032]|uniref:XRE family transcriptional regulator n=1 Tax=Streptomyces sp. NPDC094032 TaxID=3155308 RepID=UPI00331B7ED8
MSKKRPARYLSTMKNSKRPTTPAPAHASTESPDFGSWLTVKLEALGYDLSGPRSGGRSAFAEQAGISLTTVMRLLKSEIPTDIRLLRTLAEAIHEPYADVLVRAGVLTPDELAAVQRPTAPPGRRITPDQAADELGITDPTERRLFLNMTDNMRRQPPPGEQQLAD